MVLEGCNFNHTEFLGDWSEAILVKWCPYVMHSANLHLVGCLYRVKPCSMQHQVLLMYRVVSHLLIANCVNSKIQRAGVGYKITKNTGRKCSPMYENSCLCVSYIFGPIVELHFVSHVIHVTVSCDQLLFAAG